MALFKINGQKLYAIAEAIRWGTGRYDEKFRPDAMPQGIRDGIVDAENRGFQEGLLQGALSVREVHTITIAEDLNASQTVKLITNNDFIKSNYLNGGFSIQLISLQQLPTDQYAIGYAYNGNRKIYANGACGISHVITASGSYNARITTTIDVLNYNGIPYVSSDGDLKVCNSGSVGTLRAGDYLVILSVAEV